MPTRAMARVPAILLGLGVAALGAALVWWALVFGVVLSAHALSLREAGICIYDSSGLCQAIAAMCTRDHALNIRVYSPELFWLALGLIGSGLIAVVLRSEMLAPHSPDVDR
jgi:hypothetical protein